ncbi:hypothetical protein BCD49_23430 [Pseudofrankia sp. EUN1h]|nr:hypothetical protein BCD49_23430 [Pseudofrankia sp. EUN1h]
MERTLIEAGLLMAPPLQMALCSGFYIEPSDLRPLEEIPDPSIAVTWLVHPNLREKYPTAWPEAREMQSARDTMLVAIKSILEFAGFEVEVDDNEMPDFLFVSYP